MITLSPRQYYRRRPGVISRCELLYHITLCIWWMIHRSIWYITTGVIGISIQDANNKVSTSMYAIALRPHDVIFVFLKQCGLLPFEESKKLEPVWSTGQLITWCHIVPGQYREWHILSPMYLLIWIDDLTYTTPACIHLDEFELVPSYLTLDWFKWLHVIGMITLSIVYHTHMSCGNSWTAMKPKNIITHFADDLQHQSCFQLPECNDLCKP